MATYTFFCGDCVATVEREEPMSADHTPPPCPNCLTTMGRVYNHASICDEIRGRTYFHPEKKHDVKGHGSYFDIGMGQWINSKSDRRKKAKALGLNEWGPRMV